MRRKIHAGTALTVTILLLAGCASDPESAEPTPNVAEAPTTPEPTGADPAPVSPDTADIEHEALETVETDLGEVEILAENLEAPWSIAFFGTTPLISERDSARILELDAEGNIREVGVVEQAASLRGEGGLLGITVHENQLYTYLTTGPDNRVIRYDLVGEPGSYELSSPQELFIGIPAAGYHNGGRIAFGPDDMLYITTGDALEPSQSQDLDSLAGKILRITPEGDIPDSNPFDDSPVYSYGHRNPQGLDWAEDGTMYSSEFGEDAWDELNIIEAGGNYGWPEVEGMGGEPEYIDPVQQWPPAEASPSAIEIHKDTIYMVALRGQRIWEIPLDDLESSTDYLVNEFGRLREATTAPDGTLWVLTNNTDGVGEPEQTDDLLLRLEAP
ncbi:PQQ-dependent sugar dehydrogenase [Enteractinococcus fodinae]|uniref:Glucose/arabinose dehydrogenase n=1 Tax=Enteractinococcus fodinae TaxID=684663 RepID=A0ABU2AXJ1_9MICC|nr:PQQ-dependent sugar dehydrogenase [Enteractinococcus fodinae]MDR7346070.1 glucose/arabinose dehydrogenase [Enteractinococcus fodinae]